MMFGGGSGLVVVLCLGGYVLVLLAVVGRRSMRDDVVLRDHRHSQRRLLAEIERHVGDV